MNLNKILQIAGINIDLLRESKWNIDISDRGDESVKTEIDPLDAFLENFNSFTKKPIDIYGRKKKTKNIQPDGSILTITTTNGIPTELRSYLNDELHREDGPAVIDEDGEQQWYINGELHREDGPAVIDGDGEQQWYINGELHREDGPAVIHVGGAQSWYINNELHREDGPAFIGSGGIQYWYINGKLHREDGPASIGSDGRQEWYINGIQIEAPK